MAFVVVGTIAIVIGAMYIAAEMFNRGRCRLVVEGKIINTFTKVEMDFNSRRRVPLYYPVYEYEVNGQKCYGTPKGQYSKMDNWFQVGDVVKLRVNRFNPKDVIAASNVRDIIEGLVFMAVGLVLVLIFKGR